jgi:hypothetical protein
MRGRRRGRAGRALVKLVGEFQQHCHQKFTSPPPPSANQYQQLRRRFGVLVGRNISCVLAKIPSNKGAL